MLAMQRTAGLQRVVTRVNVAATAVPLLSMQMSTSASASSPSKKKVVIVGGVAGGATAAARLSRLSNQFDITIIEKSPDVSFANCGLPYYIGREITDRSKLSLQTPQSLSEQLAVNVMTKTEVTKIHRTEKTVDMKNWETGVSSSVPYDYLVLSPGASPLRPKSIPGIDHARIQTLRNLQDMDAMDALLSRSDVQRVAVIGAGFIGLEMVEQLRRRGKTVYLVEKAPAVLPQADKEMAEFLHTPLIENGVHLHVGDGISSFAKSTSRGNGVLVQLESGKNFDVDLVCLSIGVRPENKLAVESGLHVSAGGHVSVDEYMRTNDSSIYAVGDVVETRDLVFPEKMVNVSLGNVANMQARVAADHMFSVSSEHSNKSAHKVVGYSGSLGTSIVRVFDNVLALTGWNEKRLLANKIPFATTTITAWDHASYYPGALPVTMKLLFDPATRRVLGAQATGIEGVDKRIDVAATAITGNMTIDQLSLTQLTYSPPFGSARDVVNIAGLAARNIVDNLVHPCYSLNENSSDDKPVKVLDVRPRENAALHPIPGSLNIPHTELQSGDLNSMLDKDFKYKTVCQLGKTAYFASRILENQGYETSTLIGGLALHQKPAPVIPSAADEIVEEAKTQPTTSVNIDCSGLSCPGPLLKLKQSIGQLPANAVLNVTATDPGFKADVKAFASSNGFVVQDLTSSKGVIHASLKRVNAEPSPAATTSSSTPKYGTIAEAAVAMSNNNNNQNGSRKGATIVVFSQDLDKVLASLVIANGAAAMGGDVTMFFTFWGLNALRDASRHAHDTKAPIDAMFGAMMPKGKDALPLSNMNFGGMGAMMLKHVMHSKNLPNIPDLFKSAQQQKIRMVACSMSMDAMGIRAEELVDGVEIGGVAEYLAAAEKTGTNLFI